MNQNTRLLLGIIFSLSIQLRAQIPNLPVKANLSTVLNGAKTFNNVTGIETLVFPYSGASEFSFEVKAKVNSSTGRGLDVQFTNLLNLGFRTSLDKTSFNSIAAFPTVENLSTSVDNAQEQTFRYVVKDGFAHIFQDGHYIVSKALSSLSDLNQVNQAVQYGADNFLGKWSGISGSNSGKPSDYGWANSSLSIPWSTANSGSGVRYMDVSSSSTPLHTYESDGTSYSGRLMYIRWDNSAYSSSTYSIPIQLEYGFQYEFSWLYEYLANASPGVKMNVAISASPDGSSPIVSKTFTSGNAYKLRKGDMSFVSTLNGKYYLTITGDSALFGIAELKLKSSNLINNWRGLTNGDAGLPSAYGWDNTATGIPWSIANSGSGVRYMDVSTSSNPLHTYESDGTSYSGRLMYLNWTDPASVYSFPVMVSSGKRYNFSWIYELITGSAGSAITVSVSASKNGSSPIATKTFNTGGLNKLKKGDLSFLSLIDGTVYVTIKADSATYAIGELGCKEIPLSQFVVGKNYLDGAVDMVVSSVTYEATAYAPEKTILPSNLTLDLNSDLRATAISKTNVVLNGATSLYLNNAFNPLINATVNLKSVDTRLYFENIKPTTILNSYLGFITINGSPAINNGNVYVGSYGTGSIVMPYLADYKPLEVFTEENYGGTSQLYQAVTPYANLGAMDNKIKSFKLKKGYMATFASNSNGTGYSRVYIAEESDLLIPAMPPYLNSTVSFLRTMRWNFVNKKGLAGGSNDAHTGLNISWYYNWNTGNSTTAEKEYVPIRQTLYWPDFNSAYTKEGYTHFLGYNEPDRPDQANMTVDQAIGGWPGLLKSGLRLGSPVTSDPFNSWMGTFMTQAENLNYRIDFMPLHCYWNKSASQWATDLQTIYNKYKRPLWITEWNIGANWTTSSFPDDPNLLTDANAAKHKSDLIAVLNVLENADYVERYSIYNWVQDARAMFVTIDDAWKAKNPNWQSYQWLQSAPVITSGTSSYVVLTPAGEYYAKNVSKKAYSFNREFIPNWTLKTETLSYELTANFDKINVKWSGYNNDLINKYVLERRLDGETNFSLFYETTDYTKLNINDIFHSKAEYRLKVVGKDNTETAYSNTIVFTQDIIPSAPTNLTADVLSATIIKLTWPAVTRALAYNIKRASSLSGPYTVVASNIASTTYQDEGLLKNTTYYYVISALNTGGESPNSTAVNAKTLDIILPLPVENVIVGSGDSNVKIEWANMYDVKYYIKRSTSPTGPFNIIATVDSGITQYQDNTVVNGTIYYYKVCAFNSLGEGQGSEYQIASPNVGQYTYYDFNEVVTPSPHDSWGNHKANIVGTNTWLSGKTGEALKLDGVSEYMDIEDGIIQSITNFTISSWVKFDALSNWVRIFDFGTGKNINMFLTPKNGDTGFYRFAIKNGGAEQQINCTMAPVVGTWTHVAITMQGSTGIMYINGTEVGRKEDFTINPSLLGNTTLNYIGKSQYNDPYLNGIIDEFRIYNVALSSSEIKSLYNLNPLPLDTDNDGIYNYKDQCLNTPQGESVNSNGCSTSQIDTDSDGVVDSLDLCPNTVLGDVVNTRGCASSQVDDDQDGIYNYKDQCPNTPKGESVNSIGCSTSQIDTDSDGVVDSLDLCPNTTQGEVVNAKGCSNNQLDDDKDGIVNSLDLCPNSPSGELVNTVGCFSLPENNFVISNIGETCPNKKNGQIIIEAKIAYNYVATLNGVNYNFTNNKLTVSDLAPGSYVLCITISGKTFEQCYNIDIPKSNVITAKTISSSNKLMVSIESGTAPYQVLVNGDVKFETSNPTFDIGIETGDKLEIKSAKYCEGTFVQNITFFDEVKAFPNPTSGQFDIYLLKNEGEVTIAIYGVDSKLISKGIYQINNGKVHIDIETQPAGIYFIKLQSNTEEVIQIIKK